LGVLLLLDFGAEWFFLVLFLGLDLDLDLDFELEDLDFGLEPPPCGGE